MAIPNYEPYDFANRRHIGPSPEEIEEMLQVVGVNSLDELIAETVPKDIRQAKPLDFGRPLSERAALDRLRETANKNRVLTSLIGQGYHGTIMPPAIQRNILESPAWYTAYTPYQPEISQGRLEALLNFQTLVADLTGLDVANASLLDEATAAAEAMALAHRATKSEATAFFVDAECLPQTIAVVKTRAEPFGWPIIVGDPFTDLRAGQGVRRAVPVPRRLWGISRFLRRKCRFARERRLDSHRRRSACAGTAETARRDGRRHRCRLHAALRHADGLRGTARRAISRSRTPTSGRLPGRLVGVSIDARGNRAYRLALQTREQHIRRESATSNICTAQVLPAVIASMYAVFHGPKGLKAIAERVHRKAARLADGLASLGFKIQPDGVLRYHHCRGRPLSGPDHEERRRQWHQPSQGRPRPHRDHGR